ncbi:MAG: hypothetical protein BWZ10_02411 [candidate division BRC1 bacterium ADurb.BinA364]|nr:MAG: hypothetical protein BWZ10_02411 [candidate division BRC1 bacterium ADurb.BinA364]
MIQRMVLDDLLAAAFPAFDLPHAAAWIFIERNVELLDQLGMLALDPIGVVFGRMLGGLGDIVAEMAHHFQPHHIAELVFPALAGGLDPLGGALLDFGIQVLSFVGDLQQPAHMVDAGGLPLQLVHPVLVFVEHARGVEQSPGADLDRMAQADILDAAGLLERHAQQRHRIGVIQKPGVGADGLDVPREIEHHGNGAKAAENPSDAQRVGDGLAQAVFLGNLEVDHGARLVAADLNGVDDEIGVAQRRPAHLDSVIGGDFRAAFVDVFVQRLKHHRRFLEPLGVDIVERELAVAQGGSQQTVAHDVLGEDRAAGPHEGDFGHSAVLS